MPAMSSENQTETNTEPKISWRCTVCGFVFTGEKPPKGCPVCHSPSFEFIPVKDHAQLRFDGEKFDVLLINGSTHRGGNTSYMADIAESALRERSVSYRRYNLSEHTIDYCWCCYAVKADSCAFPCRNKNDDMPAFHASLQHQKQSSSPPQLTGTVCRHGSRPFSTGPRAWRTCTTSANPD